MLGVEQKTEDKANGGGEILRDKIINETFAIIQNNKLYYMELQTQSVVDNDFKKLVLTFPLQTKTPYIIIKGRIFQNADAGGTRERYKLPVDISDIITPKTVSEIIIWAVSGTGDEYIDWDGSEVPV